MNCPHCERLRISVDMQADEIRRLKRELGYRRKAAETGSVMAALEIPQTPADILINLYTAGGKVVRKEALLIHMGEDTNPKTLDQHIFKIRKAMGSEAVEYVPQMGFKLHISAVSRVMAILNPPELQDARPAG